MSDWLIDKSALVRLADSPDATEWASRIERGLVQITTAVHRRANPAYVDAAHRVHARVEDGIRTGKDCGPGRFPSHDFKLNAPWLATSLIAG